MNDLKLLAREAAIKYGLDPRLICALCEVESSWIPWAVRHEAGYEWLVGFKRGYSGTGKMNLLDACDRWYVVSETERYAGFDCAKLQTELLMQQTSWGLMQIMGAVARERGFDSWLTELCDPTVNLEWGCRHLRWMIDHADDYGIEMIGSSPGAMGQHTPAAVYQSYDPSLSDLAAAWNGGKAQRISCPKCAGSGDKSKQVYVECKYCHGTGRAYENQAYVDKVLKAMEAYQ